MRFAAIVSLVCLPLLTLGQKPSFCGNWDCPTYTVNETNADLYEVRVYAPSRWVATSYNSTSYSRRNMGSPFMRLFRYIQGSNDAGAKINMTVPVLKASRGEVRTMMFYVPATHVPNTPTPTEGNVELVDLPQTAFYVRVFKTWKKPTAAKYLEELQTLKNAILSETLYNTTVSYTAGYHSPWFQGERHNEVWLEKIL